ncbi:hypothetical protein TWF106_006079 [Orbilia oligospora]|uniref:Uncharacterized protein n=1 Tax=Orbilia oligospora TaxID=2813651 RepID=A0A7C8QS72_ORBOL|nr:hypothetical protein TWF679_008854 [Orbilia oligospora]KAF3221480.1 hypothetical protein TWF106_006079 [Orbilia oligospora]
MASILKRLKSPLQKEDDGGIQISFIWLGKRLEPVNLDQDSRCQFYECTWQLGRYEHEIYVGEISDSPPMEFDFDINNERWEADSYRVDIGYVNGHNHDLKNIGSVCQWFAWKSITKSTHMVDVDTPWHIRARVNAPTDIFLPPKRNNPGGKITVVINLFRDGKVRESWKPVEKLAWAFDDMHKPISQFIFKMSFYEIKEVVPKTLSAPPLKELLVGPPGTIVSNIPKQTPGQPKIYQEDKLRCNPDVGTTGQPPAPIHIDEDIEKMTSQEKDIEIMRLRKIVADMRNEKDIRAKRSNFSRDMSLAVL